MTMMALVLTIAAQAQRDTIGVSRFTAIYRYECKTADADGQPGVFLTKSMTDRRRAARALLTAIWPLRCTWLLSS